MNVREEDRRKTASSSRGLVLATTAISLGVGAALYYFLSKGSPQQETEATSSSGWGYERANVFAFAENASDSDSYSTISEGTTSDTSIHDRTFEFPRASSVELEYEVESEYEGTDSNNESLSQSSISAATESYHSSPNSSSVSDNSFTSTAESDSIEAVSDYNLSDGDHSQSDNDSSDVESDYEESDKESDEDESAVSDYAISDNSEGENDYSQSDISIESTEDDGPRMDENYNFIFENASNTDSPGTDDASLQHNGNPEDDSDAMEWDVTNTSIGIPSEERNLSLLDIIGGLAHTISPRKLRERPWTLEECSICFDVMLRDQEIMTLSCTHNFHAQCIMPWLQEKQTCPNCRKHAE